MTRWICLLPFMLVIHKNKASENWCTADLCKGQHVLCDYNGKFHKPCPYRATAMVKMSKDMINLIVDKHNDYRNKFAGGLGNHSKAARMTTLQWDAELAQVADAMVRHCKPSRDECARTPTYYYAEVSYSLEKYYCMTTKREALRKQLDYWFDPTRKEESYKLFFSLKENEQEFSKNYFQVVRDRANRLGCAIVEYVRPALVHQLLKCVYNCGVSLCEDDHNPVYEETDNDAAEDCEKGTNSKYKNLCHNDELVKSCDGGQIFVEPERYNETDYENETEPMPTTIILPPYTPIDELPPIPENPQTFDTINFV
ncbi:hypothetical protein KR084_012650, partial [Drosophila pseudotakahashii]